MAEKPFRWTKMGDEESEAPVMLQLLYVEPAVSFTLFRDIQLDHLYFGPKEETKGVCSVLSCDYDLL